MSRSNIAKSTARPLVLALLAGSAAGQPTGEQVVAGQAAFNRAGSLTEITAADNTIINYQSFNIGAGETVRFVQPGADSRVLNRVLGQDPSRIDGSLLSNGRVYLVNEAGVYFGDRAIVSVGAIHASAGQMTDADFLGGIDRFTNLTGAVENRGRIDAGEVHLAGRRVTNLGSISSPDGLVTMSVGDRVLVGDHNGHVFVSATGAGSSGAAEQRGTIDAPGGRVLIGAGDMFSIAIGPASVTRAAEVDVRAARGSIVTVSGAIDASDSAPGGVGGDVTITGDGVALLGASIDASGSAGGGTIHIGGGFQGNDPSIAHATRLHANSATTLKADATKTGNGGQIVLWSDSATLFSGHASATGGAQSGDGGLVEVSSAGWLGFFGRVGTRAPNGKDGLLLLDPENIVIVSGAAGTGADDALLDDNQLPDTESAGLDVQISDGTIEALDDSDVLIAATGDISVSNLADGSLALPVSAGNTFTFDAGGFFVMVGTGSITSNGGNIVINAGEEIQVPAVRAAGGDVTLQAGSVIRTVRAFSEIGALSLTATGGDREITVAGLDADSIAIDADRLVLAGSIFSRSALDLSGLSTIISTNPGDNFTIGAVDGADTFAISLNPAGTIEGPGGLRFIASTLTLPDVNLLSALEVTATDELIIAGDILLDNDPAGLGGRLDLSDTDLVTLAADVLIDTDRAGIDAPAGDVNLSGTTVRAMTAGVQQLTIDTTSDTADAGGIITLGNIGGDRELGGLTLTAPTLRLTGTLATSSALALTTVDQIEVVGSNAAIETNGAGLDLGAVPIDGAGSLRIDLTAGMAAPGALTYTGVIGDTTPLTSFTLLGGTFTLPVVTTTGNQTYTGDQITLPATITSEGGTIDFNGAVAVAAEALVESIAGEVLFRELVSGAGDLTVDVETGDASFFGSATLGSLSVLGTARFDGAAQTIQTTGDLVLGETLGRDRVEMLAGAKVFRSTTGDVIFNGPLNGPANVTVSAGPATSGSNIPVVRFASNIGGAQSLASLTLGQTQAVIPQVASIVFAEFASSGDPVAGRSFTIRTTGNLTMGQNEKLTALGSLLMESISGIVTLGDVTAVNALRVNAPRIDVRTRAIGTVFEVDASQQPEVLLDAAGRTDTGVDLVSGDSVLLDSGDIRVIGSGTQPVISDPTGQAKIRGIQTRASTGLTLEQAYFNRRVGTGGGAITDETTVLDARATGSTTVPLAEALPAEFAEISDVEQASDLLAAPNPESGELAPGDQGGILLRRTTPEERRWARDGVIWHIDLAESPMPGAGDFRIASARLDSEGVVRFRRAWNELAEAVGVDPSNRDEVLARVRSVLGVAVDQYKRSSGEEFIDPQHFALYSDLRTANADAWRALQLVAAISEGSESLGLTPVEAVRFRKGLVESIRPRGLDTVDLSRLIEFAGQSERQNQSVEAPAGQR